MTEPQAWAILFLPLASFVIIALLIRPFLNQRYSRLSGYVTIAAVGAAFVLSLSALKSTLGSDAPIGWASHPWLNIGDLEIRVGILLDPLTAIMLVVVTGVSLLVQVYSQGYMKGDPGYSRYFAFMSLFTASMLGVVLASSILQLYVFWEMVGLCSYLLIGFWYHRPAAAAAAKKAFIVTRIGDVGFLLAILYLFLQRDTFVAQGLNPFEIRDIWAAALVLPAFAVTWLSLGIFAGAVGKSGQFPLHTWLPDAMEGPTPVSALIHAATMVAAGVFLVARFFPLFQESATAMHTVALIGGFTAVFAATMGLVMYDIKRVMAYSTVSQLGYMMLALGIGAPGLAIFHLFNHAFFKALLFLGAGSVNHATGTFDMRYMGGLRKHMPITYVTMLIGSLSLAGIFPLSGFWSKDEILLEAWRGGDVVDKLVFWMALAGVFLTAFYVSRMMFMTFHGSFRGGAEAEGHGQGAEHAVHLAESPWVMSLPLVVLGVLALGSGYVANPLGDLAGIPAHWFVEFLGGHAEEASLSLAAVSTLVALAGIGLAVLMYQTRTLSPDAVGRALRPARDLLFNKYYLDNLYEGVIVGRFFYRGVARFLDWVDREVIDRTGDGVGWLGRNLGRGLAPVQSGQMQAYGVVISLGILAIIGAYLVFGR
ncbi:MAG: NADH-quinone oxidoreductase subunit L [Dehalococcoidia bacterium]|nr:NADH-quinone oxidoreductase subunit L [Dehalococcoidia bacterium]